MKLLHAADLHLDSPLGQLPTPLALQRRRELRQLPARIARLAREEEVELVLLPGDLFDGQRVCPETIQALTQALADIPAPVLLAPGNHDCYHAGSPYDAALWPDNVHIFTQPCLTAVALPALNCVIHGCAFTQPHREDDPLAGYAVPRDGRLHLLCLHGELSSHGGRYAPIAPSSLAGCGAQYAALGHVHTATQGQEGDTCWAYPGCPEGRGFDELGEKGALIVQVQPGQVQISFRPLCQRQYRVQEVPATAFADSLPDPPSPDLVRLLLTGPSARPQDLWALTAQAAPHFFHVEVRDETALPQNLWARQEEDSLTGLFLREMRRQLDQAEGSRRPALLLAVRFGLAALEGGEDFRP